MRALSNISSSDDGRVRSDLMRTFLKTTRESGYVIKSLLSFFFSVLGGLSLCFFVSLSFCCCAGARCVSLSLFLSPPTTHQGGEDFGDVLDDDDENHETSERMR